LWEAGERGCENVGGESAGTEEGEDFVEFVFVAEYCCLKKTNECLLKEEGGAEDRL
jgi:hypothetical protein